MKPRFRSRAWGTITGKYQVLAPNGSLHTSGDFSYDSSFQTMHDATLTRKERAANTQVKAETVKVIGAHSPINSIASGYTYVNYPVSITSGNNAIYDAMLASVRSMIDDAISKEPLLHDSIVDKLSNPLQGLSIDLAQDLYEIGEVIQLAKNLADLYKTAKRDPSKIFAKRRIVTKGTKPKGLAQVYFDKKNPVRAEPLILQYQFGIKPLQDALVRIQDSLDNLNGKLASRSNDYSGKWTKDKSRRVIKSQKLVTNLTSWSGGLPIRITADNRKAVIQMTSIYKALRPWVPSIPDFAHFILGDIGVHTAYELIPMSWLIDMFIDIGGFLKKNIPAAGARVEISYQPYCRVITATASVKVEVMWGDNYVPLWNGTVTIINRDSPTPYAGKSLAPLDIKVPGLSQSLTIAALISTLVKTK